MQQIADLHIHSKYSRACSKNLTLENIDKVCRVKGIDIIATGDFTHPAWFSSIKNEFIEIDGSGLYKHKNASDANVKFILQSEIALIYKSGGKARRIHLVLHAPSIESAERLNKELDKNYNIKSDGRPILGMSAEKLCELCFKVDPKFLIYPAHIWTPWFSVFGSKSGFDRLEDCFGEYTSQIYAFETGLSSDPEMNWRVSALDNLTMLSNSDAHSLPNLAREANVFELQKITFDEIYKVIKNKQTKKEQGSYLNYTIEFYPEEGMYHYDGHRDCNICLSPMETKKHKGICPKCKKPITIGVDYRVEELADRPLGTKPKNTAGFKKLVELDKIIAEAFDIKSRNSKKVIEEYDKLTKNLGTELEILMNISIEDINEICSNKMIGEGIKRVREGNLIIKPGFDGQYGVVKIFDESSKDALQAKQRSFFNQDI